MSKNNNFIIGKVEISLFVIIFAALTSLLIYKLSVEFYGYFKSDPKSTKKNQVINTTREIPIITYHYIEVVTDKRDTIRQSLAITPIQLKKEILQLKTEGYSFIFVKDIPRIIANYNYPVSHKIVALTFDDGYRDFYTDAYPIIKETGAKATVFVISNFINGSNYMTQEQVKEIASSGFVEIGAHTANHTDLVSVSTENAKAEIEQSKASLEQKFGINVESFAYPYGFYNDNVKKLVKDAGFLCAVSDKGGVVQSIDNMYALNRVRVGYFFKF